MPSLFQPLEKPGRVAIPLDVRSCNRSDAYPVTEHVWDAFPRNDATTMDLG